MALTRCFSSLGCPELSLEATLALAAKHRVPLVELRVLDGSVDLPAHFTAHFGTPARLAAHVAGSGVRVVAFDASLRLVGGTEADRAQLAALAPWAEVLGVRWLRVFDGGKDMTDVESAEAAATLGWWRELRAAHGWRVDLMVETHDSLLTAAAIARFMAAAPGTAILWDAHHTWRKGGEDPVATWRAIRSGVVHVHVKDSIGVPSARHPFTYVLPGDGEFPVRPLLAALQADGFRGPVSLEWEKLWHPYLPSLDAALTAAAARRWW
jgi:sugar phosphate isomerase/epimerase